MRGEEHRHLRPRAAQIRKLPRVSRPHVAEHLLDLALVARAPRGRQRERSNHAQQAQELAGHARLVLRKRALEQDRRLVRTVSRGGLGDRVGGGQTDRSYPQVAVAALGSIAVASWGRPN